MLYLKVLFEYFFPPIINLSSQDTSPWFDKHWFYCGVSEDSYLEEFHWDTHTVVFKDFSCNKHFNSLLMHFIGSESFWNHRKPVLNDQVPGNATQIWIWKFSCIDQLESNKPSILRFNDILATRSFCTIINRSQTVGVSDHFDRRNLYRM